jgi:hypothetical protein
MCPTFGNDRIADTSCLGAGHDRRDAHDAIAAEQSISVLAVPQMDGAARSEAVTHHQRCSHCQIAGRVTGMLVNGA